MTGWLARERFERGWWDEAVRHAHWVLARPGVAPVSAISAEVVVARIRARRGDPDVWPMLDQAMAMARASEEVQRLVPVVAARAEAAWLAGEPGREIEGIETTLAIAARRHRPWLVGELALAAQRAGASVDLSALLPGCAEPYRLQVTGQLNDAAAAWATLGCPYEAADCAADSDDPAVVAEAHRTLLAMGARPRARQAAERLRVLGVGAVRGQNVSTRQNPHGLTDRELDVARLLASGDTDQQIGDRLFISRKTTSHHVSHILTKLGARNRSEAAAIIANLTV